MPIEGDDPKNPELVSEAQRPDLSAPQFATDSPPFLRPSRRVSSLRLALRWMCVGLLTALCVYFSLEMLHRTPWYRQRILQKLYSADPKVQLRAATTLAHFKCEEELLIVLKSDVESARELGRRALEHIWFNEAGKEAYRLLQKANEAMEKKEHQRAMAILDRMIDTYPDYAEAWNRRGSLHWELGDYEKSLADSERALALNPNHYGAMQGIGVCFLQLGDVAQACHYLRSALKILPHDEATRRSLQRCEELLRVFPAPNKAQKQHDLI